MMFNYFLYIFVFIFLSLQNSYSNNIEKIIIEGNQRISSETILVLSNLNEGNNYDDQTLNESLKKLYDSNFFESIEFDYENDGVLKISIIENPIIERLEITGIKSKTIINSINNVISLKNRMSFNENLVSADIKKINNLLKTNGYYFAEVKSLFEKNKTLNSVILKYNIDLGSKAKIKKISFLGDKKIKDKKLLEIIASEEHKFWKFISNNVYLNEGLVNLDKRLLENYYKNLGYYNIKILSSFAAYNNNDNSFELIYNINSGNKFYFNEIKLNLPSDYNPDDFVQLDKTFEGLKNELYSIDKFNIILDSIDNIASSKLYEFIDAKVNEQIIDKNKINFTINLIDTNKFYVEKINVLGNYITIEEVIRNKFIVDEGDALNNLLLNKSLDNIRSLGIFQNVNHNIKDGKDDNL
jgi:outer membrane protein insertion porin family